VSDDIDLLWTLVSGVLLLLMAAGMGAVIEGFSRRRSVSTGSGRHVATTAGAVVGSVITSLYIGEVAESPELWLAIATSVLLATIVSGAVVERATFAAHTGVGLAIGGVVVPGIEWAQSADGVLSSIEIEGEPFFDAAAATIFTTAGWMALVGIMVIGPRRGRLSADGRVRIVPGKSMPAAAVGVLVVLASSVGLAGRPLLEWDSALSDAAPMIYIAAASGAVIALLLGWQQMGASSTASLVHGVLAGSVASLGAPLELTVARAAVLGAIGSALAVMANRLLDRFKVDDPVGIIGVFGVAGLWGSIAAGPNASSVAAQVIGALIIASWAVVCAGVVFGALRIVRLLRISPDVEVVGLEA